MKDTKTIPYKIYLEEKELPTTWYNVRADMKNKPAPLLNPGTLQPMKAVPLTAQEEPAVYAAAPAAPPGGRNTSGRTPERAAQSIHDWSAQHATDIDQYNAWAEQREPYSQRVRRWRAEQKK